MQTVRIVKQWRGHAAGTEPELTDERAAELIRSGFAQPLNMPVAEPEPESSEAEEEHPRSRKRRRR